MPRALVDIVLGKNKELLQEQLRLFCRQYQSCLGVDGAMDSARKEVFRMSRQLVAQAKAGTGRLTSATLTGVIGAELQVMDVGEQLSGLNTDAVRIVEAIRLKVRAFIMTLAQQHGGEEEDRRKLLEAFHATSHVAPSQQQDMQMADLLTTEELRCLEKFATSDVSDPAHQAALEDLTKQMTVRICQSVMEEAVVPNEAITDTKACFHGHLEDWQSTVTQIHEQREKVEKAVNDQRRLQRGIDSASKALGELTKLRDMSVRMCESLQAEIKAPSAFHKAMSYMWHWGGKSDAVQKKEKELGLRQEATRHISELIAVVDRTLAEARAEQENPIDLEHIMHKLDEVDGLVGSANESLSKVKEDLKAYEAGVAEREEARRNSFGYRWRGVAVTAAIGVVTTVVAPVAEAAIKGRMGLS